MLACIKYNPNSQKAIFYSRLCHCQLPMNSVICTIFFRLFLLASLTFQATSQLFWDVLPSSNWTITHVFHKIMKCLTFNTWYVFCYISIKVSVYEICKLSFFFYLHSHSDSTLLELGFQFWLHAKLLQSRNRELEMSITSSLVGIVRSHSLKSWWLKNEQKLWPAEGCEITFVSRPTQQDSSTMARYWRFINGPTD